MLHAKKSIVHAGKPKSYSYCTLPTNTSFSIFHVLQIDEHSKHAASLTQALDWDSYGRAFFNVIMCLPDMG